ncbi:MAG: hypothetical protein H6744_01620 [Deltaproteobacteria bacterium]|nr:hypothetical protein [Deltaproteobacteria bacterium]
MSAHRQAAWGLLLALGCCGGPGGGTDASSLEEVAPKERQARVYLHDPKSDDRNLTEVSLPLPTSADGALTNGAADVQNCLPEPGGPSMGDGIFFCHERQVARPRVEGHYLHIRPPTYDNDPTDSFAEVMAYHHVNRIHDYYRDAQGLELRDHPIRTLVNVQVNQPGGAGWVPLPNALYLPPESFEELGIEGRPEEALLFGHYEFVDFSYDASVIYHEYTHAVLGPDRLSEAGLDRFGLDLSPGSLNEGLADYFAASVLDRPLIGTYALLLDELVLSRDLTRPHHCPDDLYGEAHLDGRIVASALWSLRQVLGAPTTDAMVMDAIAGLGASSGFEAFGQLVVAAARERGAEVESRVLATLTEYGVLGCERVRPWVPFDSETDLELTPYALPGLLSGPGEELDDGAPGYFQWSIDLLPSTAAVRLEYRGEASDVDILLRREVPVEFGLALGGPLLADARLRTVWDPATGVTVVTISGDCLAAKNRRLYLLFLNRAEEDGYLERMDIAQLDAVPQDSLGGATCQ